MTNTVKDDTAIDNANGSNNNATGTNGRRLMVNDLPEDQKPRNQLISKGAEWLSTPEILAIVIRTGTVKEGVLELAERLYRTFPLKELARCTVADLSRIAGIGEATACQIIASIELGKRVTSYGSHPVFTRPAEAAQFLMAELTNLSQEHFKCLYLNRRNRLIHDRTHFIGTRGESLVDPSPILREALLCNASSIILAHNHPSGDPNPSEQDIHLTQRLSEAASLIGVQIFDHIIIGDRNFVSLAERGCLPD